jgi:hypothetical protein
MASQIGLTVNALGSDNVAFGSAVEFTIDAGSTTRVFLVSTNHASINPTSIPSAQFITGTTNFTHGHIRVDPLATNPNRRTDLASGGLGNGYNDATMLSYWGSVIVEQNTTGFAMEFIGDMSDSQATAQMVGNPQVVGPAAP